MRITILGGGTWGTTLADMYAKKGYDVLLWLRNKETAEEINKRKTNTRYTREKKLSENIEATTSIKGVFNKSRIVFVAVPSHAIRKTLIMFKGEINNIIKDEFLSIINVAKGFELDTNKRMEEIFEEELPESVNDRMTTLSGPNIAMEIFAGLPSVSVIAGKDAVLLKKIQKAISTEYFRIYTNTDIVGVELCGSLKNIVAIAAGISDGLGYGANAKASLITRGLNELERFGRFFGANPRTFPGVAGMGDLITTCISSNSRNRHVGEMLAKGIPLNEILESLGMVAEGVNTTKAVYSIAAGKGIELPITESVYEIIYMERDPLETVTSLMQRKFKSEV